MFIIGQQEVATWKTDCKARGTIAVAKPGFREAVAMAAPTESRWKIQQRC